MGEGGGLRIASATLKLRAEGVARAWRASVNLHRQVSRLEALQKSGAYTVALAAPLGRGLSARDVACRIMRKVSRCNAQKHKSRERGYQHG